MNIYQKVCIALGALVIAFLFLNPITATKELADPSYNPEHHGIFYGNNPTMTVKYADYGATTSRAVGVAVATGALVVLLGSIKIKDNK